MKTWPILARNNMMAFCLFNLKKISKLTTVQAIGDMEELMQFATFERCCDTGK